MKKIAVLVLVFVFCVIAGYFRPKTPKYKIIKIKSANEFYVDFDNNGAADEDELVEIHYVRAFALNLMTSFSSAKESCELSYLAEEFALKNLLNKDVTLTYDKANNLISVKAGMFDYAKELSDKGLGLINPSVKNSYKNNPQKIKENLAYAKTLNLVSYNPHSNKYHKLDCNFAYKSTGFVIKPLSQVQKTAQPCKFCHPRAPKHFNEKKEEYPHIRYPRIEFEKYSPAHKDGAIELYLSDFTKYYYPSNKCVVTACQSLLREIKTAKFSIDFAIYGVANQPELIKALKDAQNRGVKIRWVYDLDAKGNSIYSDTKTLAKTLIDAKADRTTPDIEGKYSNSIMHNKFFIFDNKKVWIGSANISETDMSGFNSNSVILINSPVIAKIYQSEFEQLHNGYFHKSKTFIEKTQRNTVQNSTISVYFSPKDKSTETAIIPLVQNAKKYIYMPVFVITHKNLIKELTLAHQRGVDVKIILDATGANNRYSPIKALRESGIKVKAENRAGKMHMKSILIDDKYTIMGSMNFSKSGESYNDENILIIENPKMTQAFKSHFIYLWSAIPDKWLTKTPRAESFQSINSCYDGIDNNHDGKIDKEDDGCIFKSKKMVPH